MYFAGSESVGGGGGGGSVGEDPHGQSRFWRECARVGFKINKSGDMTVMLRAEETCGDGGGGGGVTSASAAATQIVETSRRTNT